MVIIIIIIIIIFVWGILIHSTLCCHNTQYNNVYLHPCELLKFRRIWIKTEISLIYFSPNFTINFLTHISPRYLHTETFQLFYNQHIFDAWLTETGRGRAERLEHGFSSRELRLIAVVFRLCVDPEIVLSCIFCCLLAAITCSTKTWPCSSNVTTEGLWLSEASLTATGEITTTSNLTLAGTYILTPILLLALGWLAKGTCRIDSRTN